METTETRPRATVHDRKNTTISLPIGEFVGDNFNLENAVCSHGLFMMAPNKWDPHLKTLERPLRLSSHGDSVNVRISHPEDTPNALQLRIFDVEFLSNHQQQSLVDQVRRMLRLSKQEEQNVREFQEMYIEAKEKGFGRLFRSPTLFEDMVKCILLCNCQWSRTLSMATALCEVQMELKCHLSSFPVREAKDCSASRNPVAEIKHLLPRTPKGKEVKRRNGTRKGSTVSAISNTEVEKEMVKDFSFNIDYGEIPGSDGIDKRGTNFSTRKDDNFHMPSDDSPTLAESPRVNLDLISDVKSLEMTTHYSSNCIGNFPSPAELVSIDENILANRCKLGYRAKRISSLARAIVEGRIQLVQLEEACSRPSLSIYDKLADQLKKIEGFGPYTCANVLMCMGFYHVVPSDSETIRHIKQVHKRKSDIRTIGQDIKMIYGRFAPFQYLVYWSEVWSFYEEKFGRLSEMIQSDYKLITATNLVPKTPGKQKKNKRIKLS